MIPVLLFLLVFRCSEVMVCHKQKNYEKSHASNTFLRWKYIHPDADRLLLKKLLLPKKCGLEPFLQKYADEVQVALYHLYNQQCEVLEAACFFEIQ